MRAADSTRTPSLTHKPPLVSVVMPAFNAALTIERTIRSVLAQSYGKLELVIVDDGSTDATRAIAESYAQRDSRVRVLSEANQGVARARNLGMEAAHSELIAPIDADDLWHCSKLEKQVAALMAAGERTAFVYALFRIIDEEDRVLRSAPAYGLRGRVLCRHVLVNFVGNGSAMLMRRSAAMEAGGYDASLQQRGAQGCEDFLLQLRMARRHHVEVVPEYLVGYRRWSGSMSSDMRRMARSYTLAFDELRRECTDIPRATFGWGIAPFIVDQAIGSLRRGELVGAVRLLANALGRDPGGALAHLETRIGDEARAEGLTRLGLLRAKLTPWPTRAVRRHFYDFEPDEAPVPWPSSALLERRLLQLQTIDERHSALQHGAAPAPRTYQRAHT